MAQAIQVKFLAATNTKGARYKATAVAGSITVGYDYALNSENNHKAAAQALMDKFGWPGELVGGQLKDGSYVFVMVNTK